MTDRSEIKWFKIKPTCTQCKVCAPICPTSAIFQGINQYVIDSDACTACGLCAKICPESAIIEVPRSG